MTDLIKRDDALAACDIAPPDEWNDYTKGGYDFAAEECRRNIAALPANPVVNDPAADRIEELNERLTAATDDAKEAEAYAEQLEERNKELALQLLAVHGQAADALDKLAKAEKDRDGYLAERNKFQLYLQRTHADCELEVAAVDALTAKLAKAVETLRFYAPQTVGGITFVGGDDAGKRAAAVLAELEGEE